MGAHCRCGEPQRETSRGWQQGRDVREAGGLPAGHTPVPYGDEGVCVAQWLVRRHLATRARGGTARPAASAFGRSQAARPVTPSPSRSKLHQLRGLQLHTGILFKVRTYMYMHMCM